MKINYKNLSVVILSLLCVLIMGVLSVWYIGNKRDEQNERLMQAEQDNIDARERLSSADKDLRLYQEYAERYQKFEAMGLFNQEDRAGMTENLVQASKKIGVFDLEMQLSAQNELDTQPNSSDSDVPYFSDAQWRRSHQNISFFALHEMDALKFFKALDWDKRLQQFERCEISSTRISMSPSAKNIKVSCSLNWSTLYLLPKEKSNAP